MEKQLVFYVDGYLLLIERDQGERDMSFSLRVNFITGKPDFSSSSDDDTENVDITNIEAFNASLRALPRYRIYEIEKLKAYSRIYADKKIHGLVYPGKVEAILKNMINFQEDEFIYDVTEELKKANDITQDEVVEAADEKVIGLESGVIIEPIGENSSLQIVSGDEPEDVVGMQVFQITTEPAFDNDHDSVQIHVDNEEKSDSIVACGNDECSIPAAVKITDPVEETTIIIEPRGPVNFTTTTDENGFLSVRYEAPITIDEVVYDTVLHLFADKSVKFVGDVEQIAKLDPKGNIGMMSRMVEKLQILETNQEQIEEFMYEANLLKFQQNEDLKIMLANTGMQEIIYAYKDDTYWGRTWGIGPGGSNKLGKILMRIRGFLVPDLANVTADNNIEPPQEITPEVEKAKEEDSPVVETLVEDTSEKTEETTELVVEPVNLGTVTVEDLGPPSGANLLATPPASEPKSEVKPEIPVENTPKPSLVIAELPPELMEQIQPPLSAGIPEPTSTEKNEIIVPQTLSLADSVNNTPTVEPPVDEGMSLLSGLKEEPSSPKTSSPVVSRPTSPTPEVHPLREKMLEILEADDLNIKLKDGRTVKVISARSKSFITLDGGEQVGWDQLDSIV